MGRDNYTHFSGRILEKGVDRDDSEDDNPRKQAKRNPALFSLSRGIFQAWCASFKRKCCAFLRFGKAGDGDWMNHTELS